MSKIPKLINTKQLKSTIVSLLRSSSTPLKQLSSTKPDLSNTLLLPLPFSKPLTSKQSLFSNSFPCTRVTHSRSISSYPLTECEVNYQAFSSSSQINGTTESMERKSLWTPSVPVRAYCLSHRIDLVGLMSENQANLIPHTPGIGNYIILKFGDLTDSPTPRDSYMLVFKYGSTVMFNMLDQEVDGYLKIIKRHASGMLPEKPKDQGDSTQKYLDYEVSEKRKLPTCVQGRLNHMLQNFNIDGICKIASVLGQSVALDYYSRLVDGLISEYTNVNIGLEESGALCSFKKLLKLVPRTCDDADIVSWFGIFERSDVVWKEDAVYKHMFDHLRDKFRLTQRFADLDRKFKMGELNIWFSRVEMAVVQTSLHMNAYAICIALIMFIPVVTLPIRTLETYLRSI
ncbi:hypothetical protein MKW94_017359 [Papaver nudicaule]|uniref:DUF155 domain-containing protein n=1 Tax=Papaver nudicaule TaxID=74823 RepID=A0AA41SBK0_PAPNU|nr:hypothetical protein [Papaver nudicaule]